MEQRDKKAKLQSQLVGGMIILYMAVCGGVGGYMIAQIEEYYLQERELTRLQVIFAIALVLIGIYIIATLHMYIHEIGHMIFGLLTGYRFQSIRFGSIMFVKTNQGIKLRRFNLAGTGGQCLMFPPETNEEDYPTTLYNLGGCIVNVVVAVVSLITCVWVWEYPLPATLLLISFLIGVGFALLNGIPLSALSNDGYNTGVLRKDAKARKALYRQLKINGSLAQGKSVKDLPEEWFEWEEHIPENNLTCSSGVLRFNYLMECERYEEAKKLGNFLLENAKTMADVHSTIIKTELLFCDILFQEEPEKIKEKFEKEKKKMLALKTIPSMQRFLYAYYLLIDKDAKKAEEYKKLFEKTAKTYPYPAEMEAERRMFEVVDELKRAR